MSYQAANEIVTMYMQSNATRINNAMESAYKEALTQYQSEQEARKAALSVLKLEQKSYDDYLKILARNMKELRSGNINMAKKRAEIEAANRYKERQVAEKNRRLIESTRQENKEGQYKVDFANRKALYNDAVARLKIEAASEQKLARLKQDQQDALKGLATLDMDARKHASKVAPEKEVLDASVNKGISTLRNVFGKMDSNPTWESDMSIALDGSDFHKGVDDMIQSVDLQQKTDQGLIGDYPKDAPKTIIADRQSYRKAAIREAIEAEIMKTFNEAYTGSDKEEKRKEVLGQVRNMLNTKGDDLYKINSGKFEDVQNIGVADLALRYDLERQMFKQSKDKALRDKINKDYRLDLPPPPMKRYIKKSPVLHRAVLRDVPKDDSTEKDYIDDLRRAAQPVFDELRQEDDTPFVLTKEEIGTVAEGAIDAYKELQIARTRTPYIPVEERRLLDDMALERQLNILRQRQQVASINPRLQRQEQIRSRAGQLLESQEPRKKVDPGSPLEQRFYATQGEALKMSHESDEELSSRGKPEEMGSMLYKSSFDPLTSQFRENQSYQSVVDKIEKDFTDPIEQFRSIAAYNSRVMKQQRSKSPIVLEDGSTNRQYLEALNAMGQKKEK
jgi:hypothetical protein